MKYLFIGAAAALLAGCASMENGSVQTASDGTPLYGLEDQPQTSVAGEGSLVPGTYNARQLPTGQFTGQERTHDVVGQRPTLPRETDAREMSRTSQENIGVGVGSLGQAGVNRTDTQLNPALSPSASDIYRSGAQSGQGAAPLSESGNGSQTNNPSSLSH